MSCSLYSVAQLKWFSVNSLVNCKYSRVFGGERISGRFLGSSTPWCKTKMIIWNGILAPLKCFISSVYVQQHRAAAATAVNLSIIRSEHIAKKETTAVHVHAAFYATQHIHHSYTFIHIISCTWAYSHTYTQLLKPMQLHRFYSLFFVLF